MNKHNPWIVGVGVVTNIVMILSVLYMMFSSRFISRGTAELRYIKAEIVQFKARNKIEHQNICKRLDDLTVALLTARVDSTNATELRNKLWARLQSPKINLNTGGKL